MKDSTVDDLDNLLNKSRMARSRLEPQWYLSLAYFMNEQWVAWDGRMLYRPQMPKNRITVVDNRINPAVRVEIARMTRTDPIFTVVPNTSDQMDTNAADLSEKIMRYLWTHLEVQDRLQEALLWSRICCAGFIKCYWDSTLGDSNEVLMANGKVMQNPTTGAPLLKGQAPEIEQMPNVVVKRVSQGDIKVEVRSPFQVYPDPLAGEFTEAEWVIEESVKSVEYVERRYGVTLTADTPANPGLVEARMGSVFMPGQGAYKGIKVREYWAKPSSTHPNGRRAVWATAGSSDGGKKPVSKLLFEDNNPFDAMPYVMLTGIQVPGRLWPMSVVELLRGPQTELNKIKSQIAENRNRVGNPTILASRQAVQDPDKFVQSLTVPGGVLFFDDIGSPNAVPSVLQAPNLPEYVVQSVQMTEESIQEISGQHDVSSAQVPPGVTAASAINLLQEADDTRLGPAMRDYERQMGRLGQKLLKLVARYYDDQRTIRLAGDDGAWEIFDFKGSQLRENTHVEVQAGSAFPQSKAAKQAAMQDLLTFFVQSGNPPQGRQLAQFLKDWEVGGAERLIEEYSLNEQQINRENVLLAQGQPLNINDWDNDEEHVAGHNDFRKEAKYFQLPPQIQQIFAQHVAAHQQRLAQMAQQQAQMAIQAQQQAAGNSPEQAQQQADQQQQQGQQQLQQGQQQMALQGAQAQQQMDIKGAQQAQQQGASQAQMEQQIRQAEELHQQKLRHAEEQHQSRLAQIAQQPQGAQQRGQQRGK